MCEKMSLECYSLCSLEKSEKSEIARFLDHKFERDDDVSMIMKIIREDEVFE